MHERICSFFINDQASYYKTNGHANWVKFYKGLDPYMLKKYEKFCIYFIYILGYWSFTYIAIM